MSSQSIFTIVFIAIAIWFLSYQAGRLDRLHHRIEVTELALHGQLVRRGGIVAELAAVPGVDPALCVLWGQAAHEVLILQDLYSPRRTQVEDELREGLEVVEPGAEELYQMNLQFFRLTDQPWSCSTEPTRVGARNKVSKELALEKINEVEHEVKNEIQYEN